MYRRVSVFWIVVCCTTLALYCTHSVQAAEDTGTKQKVRPTRTPATDGPAKRPAGVEPEPKNVAADSELPKNVLELFRYLDKFGRRDVKGAKLVQIEFTYSAVLPRNTWTEKAWLLSLDDDSVTVLRQDLIPWVYKRNDFTKDPFGMRVRHVRLTSVRPVNLQWYCKQLHQPKDFEIGVDRGVLMIDSTQRMLLTHALWKKGLLWGHLLDDSALTANFTTYRDAVLNQLASLHLRRGTNMLAYADRPDILPHLRIAAEILPHGEHAKQAKELHDHLVKLIESERTSKLPHAETRQLAIYRAKSLIAQIRDFRCSSSSSPPYLLYVDGKRVTNPPAKQLSEMGMDAVPALMDALDDESPTRMVSFTRDGTVFWRTSDFAWRILNDILTRNNTATVQGFPAGTTDPERKAITTSQFRDWYKEYDEQKLSDIRNSHIQTCLSTGEYFRQQKNQRAVGLLLERIPEAESPWKGKLCELVSRFGDPSVKPVLRKVLRSDSEPCDRLHAVIGLWRLGDDAGIPVAIGYVSTSKQPYPNWDLPVWFLSRTQNANAIAAVKEVVTKGAPKRANEVIQYITAATSGELLNQRREPAGCLELADVLIAGMERGDYLGGTYNGVQTRVKDNAAKAFVLMTVGSTNRFSGKLSKVDPKLLNKLEPDEAKRDEQIERLKAWYAKNRERLTWDVKKKLLVPMP